MTTMPRMPLAMAKRYREQGYWGDLSVADYVRRNARNSPDDISIVTEHSEVTWSQYDNEINRLAAILGALLDRDDRFGAVLPDCPEFHYSLCAAERSGTIAVGIGSRSQYSEIRHLLKKSGARALVMRATHHGVSAEETFKQLIDEGVNLKALIVYEDSTALRVYSRAQGAVVEIEPDPVSGSALEQRKLAPDEISMLNSTSGTTGRPKLVTQYANRWIAFSKLAFEAADLTSQDVIMGAVPGPFGFGLWTAHYAPAMLGAKVVVMEKFDVDLMIRLIDQERATMLACVSTQFKMMLDRLESHKADLSSLRMMFTGGEAVPFERAREFEERVGAKVLQFYGSNEGGAVTNTTLKDTQFQRLMTAGKPSDGVQIRLFDQNGKDVTEQGGPGQPAVTGPTLTLGYFNDEDANRELFRDGLLLMPDVVTIDPEGYYKVVGRTSDLIIRGGKNISAVEVEEAVETHPAVKMAAAVPVPDETYGERIGVVVELNDGHSLSLEGLQQYLVDHETPRSLLPERLLVVEVLPLAPGGKISKGQVKRLFD